jgi:hypothetical protein
MSPLILFGFYFLTPVKASTKNKPEGVLRTPPKSYCYRGGCNLCCIYSWPQLKEKFLLNFQGFQAELDSEENFLSCIQREKETLSNFYRRFLQMKAQAPEVSDDQVIAQAMRALRVGPLHSHIVGEWPKVVSKLYEQFAKFSKSEIQHFHKFEQQRKISLPDKAPRPRHNEIQRSYPRPIHSIGSDGCGTPENWEKNYGTPSQ